jgi:hypothetical protein
MPALTPAHARARRNQRAVGSSGLNGRRLTLTNDEAYNLIMNVAAGHLDTVDDITAILEHATQPRD